jgi:hypothetical protein
MHAAQWLRSFPLPVDGEIRLVTVLTPVEELTRTSRLLPLPHRRGLSRGTVPSSDS